MVMIVTAGEILQRGEPTWCLSQVETPLGPARWGSNISPLVALYLNDLERWHRHARCFQERAGGGPAKVTVAGSRELAIGVISFFHTVPPHEGGTKACLA